MATQPIKKIQVSSEEQENETMAVDFIFPNGQCLRVEPMSDSYLAVFCPDSKTPTKASHDGYTTSIKMFD